MKIALIGYGKMGQEIEQILLQRGHECVLKITSGNRNDLTPDNLSKADVAIEFSTPDTVIVNIETCVEYGIPVVTGTTGWYKKFDEMKEYIHKHNGSLFYATNFSIGVNIFFKLNEILAGLMNGNHYEPSLWEEHHIQKKDHPSGTGITLAEGIISNFDHKKKICSTLEDEEIPAASNEMLHIISSRKDEVPGTHIVTWAGANDMIELKHEAHNRKGFAEGAVTAAEWLAGKKGMYTMKDMLNL